MEKEEHQIAICCYETRAIQPGRCSVCKWIYGCPTFGSADELEVFRALLLDLKHGAALPLKLWPMMLEGVPIESGPDGAVKVGGAMLDQSPVHRLELAVDSMTAPL